MQAILETDEEIKRRKKGMGSKHHSIIQGNLIIQLAFKYLEVYQAIPELSLDLNGKEKVPDLSIYKKDSISYGEDEIRMTNLPLCAVEILSPKQALSDLVDKSDVYFDAGISSYWLVVPQLQSIYVYSAKKTFKVYTRENTLVDSLLDIELELEKIF